MTGLQCRRTDFALAGARVSAQSLHSREEKAGVLPEWGFAFNLHRAPDGCQLSACNVLLLPLNSLDPKRE